MSIQDALPWKILTASGRIDALTGAETERACHEALQEVPRVALDLRAVCYMSSAGLRVLLSSLKFAGSRNGAFALIAPQETVREILDMSGFSRIIPIVDDAANLA
jgi:anti-sigma B factor antagonist